jgi:hypothetical protein
MHAHTYIHGTNHPVAQHHIPRKGDVNCILQKPKILQIYSCSFFPVKTKFYIQNVNTKDLKCSLGFLVAHSLM